MQKIVAGQFMSLDGVIESPNKLTAQYFNDEMGQVLGSQMAGSDTLLLGRVTYQEFVPFWAGKTGEEDPVAAHMSKPKFVVSATLDNTDEWQNSTLIRGNLVEELTRLKQQPGKNIFVAGSATLVRGLLREGLLDELDLLVCPVILGRGKHLFEDVSDQEPLKLVNSQAFSTGVVHLRYEPAVK